MREDRLGDLDEGFEAATMMMDAAFAPDDYDDSWSVESIALLVEMALQDSLFVEPTQLSAAHISGAADFFQRLADALDERSDEIRR